MSPTPRKPKKQSNIIARVISCKDLENVNLWNTQFCCEDCHQKADKSPLNYEIIFVKEELDLPYTIGGVVCAVMGCCALKSVAEGKLSIMDVAYALEAQALLDTLVEELLNPI